MMDNRYKTYTEKKPLDLEHKQSDKLSDSDLALELEHRWATGDFPEAEWPEEAREKLFKRISKSISSDRQPMARGRRLRFAAKAWRYAAAIMIPLLLLSTFYYYGLASQGVDCVTAIRTDRGETALVMLPDGTEVRINNESSLTYNPYAFAKGERSVLLTGEAFFSVTSDPSHPFTVSAGEVSVNVLGTKFNVNSRMAEDAISVFLEEGAVEMRCEGVDKAVKLSPLQRATYFKRDGIVEITDIDGEATDLAWLKNDMAFRNEPLSNVLLTIERTYGVEFDRATLSGALDDGFTGTLPSDDISTVLDVLEDIYDVKFTLEGRKIVAQL